MGQLRRATAARAEDRPPPPAPGGLPGLDRRLAEQERRFDELLRLLDEQNRIRQREQDRKFNELIQAVQELGREVRDQRRPTPPAGPRDLKK
jgi:hypothetical protein